MRDYANLAPNLRARVEERRRIHRVGGLALEGAEEAKESVLRRNLKDKLDRQSMSRDKIKRRFRVDPRLVSFLERQADDGLEYASLRDVKSFLPFVSNRIAVDMLKQSGLGYRAFTHLEKARGVGAAKRVLGFFHWKTADQELEELDEGSCPRRAS